MVSAVLCNEGLCIDIISCRQKTIDAMSDCLKAVAEAEEHTGTQAACTHADVDGPTLNLQVMALLSGPCDGDPCMQVSAGRWLVGPQSPHDAISAGSQKLAQSKSEQTASQTLKIQCCCSGLEGLRCQHVCI